MKLPYQQHQKSYYKVLILVLYTYIYTVIMMSYYTVAETTISHTNPSTESGSHSPLPIPRIGIIALGLVGGIVLIFLVELLLFFVYLSA